MSNAIKAFVLLLAVAVAVPAAAQSLTGVVTGTVKDEQGGVLPGVLVTLQGVDATRAFTSEERGEFRFYNLAPSRCSDPMG